MTNEEISGFQEFPEGARIFRLKHPSPIGYNKHNVYEYEFEFEGKLYKPPINDFVD